MRGLIVITAGFKEVGVGRRAARGQAQGEARSATACGWSAPTAWGSSTRRRDVPAERHVRRRRRRCAGTSDFVSQSGALGEAILADAVRERARASPCSSRWGTRPTCPGNDLLEYWEDNPDVQAILMYLGVVRATPGASRRSRARVTRKKPIVAVKAAAQRAGARARPRTPGRSSGSDVASDTLLEQCGVAARVVDGGDVHARAGARAISRSRRGPHRDRHERGRSRHPLHRRAHRAPG